jgi:hypothetical protein
MIAGVSRIFTSLDATSGNSGQEVLATERLEHHFRLPDRVIGRTRDRQNKSRMK